MVLVDKLSKIYFKLENHLHHHHHHQQEVAAESLQASLEGFRSETSVCLNRLLSNSKPGSEFLSFSWIQQCFDLLQVINKAFAKMVVEIDYSMSKWEADSVKQYLNYSLCLMEFLNCISSCVSHLGQARLALSHALSLVEDSPSVAIERLRAFQIKSSSKEFKRPENSKPDADDDDGGDDPDRVFSNKERVVSEALMELKRVGFWVCGLILTGLSGDPKAYMEMRKSQGGFSNSALRSLDSSICEVIKEEKGGVLKEVRELTDSASCLAAALATGEGGDNEAEELQRRLEVFEKVSDSLGKEVDHLFSKLLAGRNELVDGIRHQINK